MQRRVARPLRARLQLLIVLGVLGFGTLNVVLVGRIAYRALRLEQERRLSFAARVLAQGAVRPILIDDRFALQKLIDGTRELDPDLAYVVVLDSAGQRLASSGWPRPSARQEDGEDLGRAYREVVQPILDGQLGVVRTGVEETTLQHALGRILGVIALMVLAFLAVGIAAAAVVARSVTGPLERLIGFAEGFRLEGPLPPIDAPESDETAELARHLEDVARRLQGLHAEARARDREMARVEHLAAVGSLAAGVAHEVRNPLAGIRTAIERLLRQSKDPAEAERYGAVLREAIARIEATVQGTLSFARASDVHVAPVRVQDALGRALELAGPKLESGRIVLTQEVPAGLSSVLADAPRLTQVILNIVLNACDAMPAGGEIRLRAARQDGAVALDLEDTGSGVSQSLADRIFDPFFTTKPPGLGTGLGLAVSRAAVREMGGELSLAPARGHGACFRILLPVAGEEADGAHPAR